MKRMQYFMLLCTGFVSSTHAMDKKSQQNPSNQQYQQFHYIQPLPVSAPIPIPSPTKCTLYPSFSSTSVSQASSVSPSAPEYSSSQTLTYDSTEYPPLTPPSPSSSPSLSATPPQRIVSTPITHTEILAAGYSVSMPAQGSQDIPCAEAVDMKIVEDFENMLEKLPLAHRNQYVIRVAKKLNDDGCLALAKFAAVKGTKTANGQQRNLHNTTDTTVQKNAQLALAALQNALPRQKKWWSQK
jgi:hypothetical protein